MPKIGTKIPAIAEALGVSVSRVSQLKAQGMPTTSAAAALKWRRENCTPARAAPWAASFAAGGGADPPGGRKGAQSGAKTGPDGIENQPEGGADPPPEEDFAAARTRREISEANMAEMRERELAGQLIRVDAVRASGARTVATARDALLQIPHRMTAYLTPEVLQMLEAEIRSVMLELSNLGRTK